MGKPFSKELGLIKPTLEWASKCDILGIRRFLMERQDKNLICIGSGGPSSACRYAAILDERFCSKHIVVGYRCAIFS